MAMQFHYGPTGKPSTSYGSPLRGMAYDAMRTRPIAQAGFGDNYVYDAMRTRPIARAGVCDVVATVKTGFDRAIEFGAGFAICYTLAPTAQDKSLYWIQAGFTYLLFGVVCLCVR